MSTLKYVRIAALLAVFVCVSAQGSTLPVTPPEKVGMSSERLERLDNVIHAYVDRGRTPGVVTLIARHGRIVHVDAYGPADLGSGRKVRQDDIFRMYSMTKPITSVALLMLYEEGKFQLTDPLGRHLPSFNNVKVFAGTSPRGEMLLDSVKRPMTIQDVFRHTAGFSYGFSAADSPVDKAYQQADILGGDLKSFVDKLVMLPLLYQPGERWVYSVSHDVQAALVEHFSGMKFDEYVKQKIFRPLGMKDAIFSIPADKQARMPALYSANPDGKLQPAKGALAENYGAAAFGGHSISATADDYVRFAQMLLNKGELNGVRLLSPKTVELMTMNHVPERALANQGPIALSSGTGYGLGVSVLSDPAQRGNIGSAGEFGWSGAASTHFLVDPKEDLIAIYLTQLMGGDFALRAEFVTLVYQAIIGD
jgi:CubicO group peptidase (beta-lactamase class C family)